MTREGLKPTEHTGNYHHLNSFGAVLMFHVAAFNGAVGQTANTAIAALLDQILTVQNSRFLLQSTRQILWAYAASTTITRARFTSPSLRQIVNPQIRPIMRAVGGATDPNFQDLRKCPLTIPPLEEFGAEVTSGLGMGNEQASIVMAIAQMPMDPAPDDEPFTVRFTGTTAAVANAWTDIVMVADDSIAAGEYAVVGADWFSATAIAFRMIFDNQVERPGGLGVAAIGSRGPLVNYAAAMGTWGRFKTTALPRFQLLAGAADNAHELYLQIVPLYRLKYHGI